MPYAVLARSYAVLDAGLVNRSPQLRCLVKLDPLIAAQCGPVCTVRHCRVRSCEQNPSWVLLRLSGLSAEVTVPY